MRRRAFVIAGAVVLLAVATVLAITLRPSSGASSDGPFGPSGQTVNESCFGIQGQVLTYNLEIVKNYGPSGATIQRISYVNPHNLQVLQTFTVPFNNKTNQEVVGKSGYPPQWFLTDRTSVIRPGRQYLLVLVTRLIGREGHADAVLVNYTENGTQYVLRTITAIRVIEQPLQC